MTTGSILLSFSPFLLLPSPQISLESKIGRPERSAPEQIKTKEKEGSRDKTLDNNFFQFTTASLKHVRSPTRYLATAHNLLFAQFLAESRSWNWSTGWLNSTKNYSFTDRGKILPRENREREKTRIREWKKPLFPIQFPLFKVGKHIEKHRRTFTSGEHLAAENLFTS